MHTTMTQHETLGIFSLGTNIYFLTIVLMGCAIIELSTRAAFRSGRSEFATDTLSSILIVLIADATLARASILFTFAVRVGSRK